MDLNALRMFVLAVDAGSLSSAARGSGVPLPTLSRRVRALEEELGARLVERSLQGLALTDAGRRLYERSARELAALAEAENNVRDAEGGVEGLLRISIPPAFEPWWTLLERFRDRHPKVSVRTLVTTRRVDLVADGIDVALRIGDLGDATNVVRPLLAYRHLVVASPTLIARTGPLTRPIQLASVPCGAFGQTAERSRWTLGDAVIELAPAVVTNEYTQLRAFALAGSGVTELPPFLARDAIAQKELVALFPKHPMPEKKVSLVFPSGRFMSSLVRAYIDFCVAEAPGILAPQRSSRRSRS